jgi:hypothetical protein
MLSISHIQGEPHIFMAQVRKKFKPVDHIFPFLFSVLRVRAQLKIITKPSVAVYFPVFNNLGGQVAFDKASNIKFR